jgi:hypothetical protein
LRCGVSAWVRMALTTWRWATPPPCACCPGCPATPASSAMARSRVHPGPTARAWC